MVGSSVHEISYAGFLVGLVGATDTRKELSRVLVQTCRVQSQHWFTLSHRRRQVGLTSAMHKNRLPEDDIVDNDSWNQEDIRNGARRTIIGARKNIEDPSIFHKIALFPLLAWIGLGADGIWSSWSAGSLHSTR